jgi:outer membrane biosynthesis protein TonB
MKPLLLGLAFAVMASEAVASESQYRLQHQEADARFITSIQRVGLCQITTPILERVRVPFELYPRDSVDRHEEGTVTMELIFDSDWCVRKATIVQSTGHWRLDNVSLSYMMTVRYMPKPGGIKEKDGEPTTVVKLAWGASQGKR